MRQRETTLRLKLATRRTTTARLIDAQENTEQERQRWLRFQNAGARSHVDCTRAPAYPVHPVRISFAALDLAPGWQARCSDLATPQPTVSSKKVSLGLGEVAQFS